MGKGLRLVSKGIQITMRIISKNIGHINMLCHRKNCIIIRFIPYPLERRHNKSMQFVSHNVQSYRYLTKVQHGVQLIVEVLSLYPST